MKYKFVKYWIITLYTWNKYNIVNQDACMLNFLSHLWFCATLWTVACQVSMWFSRQEYRTGLPCPPHPRKEPVSLMSPAVAGRFFTTSATWEAPNQVNFNKKKRRVVRKWMKMLDGWGELNFGGHMYRSYYSIAERPGFGSQMYLI